MASERHNTIEDLRVQLLSVLAIAARVWLQPGRAAAIEPAMGKDIAPLAGLRVLQEQNGLDTVAHIEGVDELRAVLGSAVLHLEGDRGMRQLWDIPRQVEGECPDLLGVEERA